MTENAPERIWAWPSERGWYAAECSNEVNLGLLPPYSGHQTEYIRKDLAKPTVKPEDILDAASEYLVRVYGIGALSHPVDRSGILSALENNS